MFCRNCGKEIDNNAVTCKYCGTTVQGSYGNYPSADDNGSAGWCVLGCLIPIVGLILYLVWKDQKPLSAKQAGKGALIGVIAGVVLTIIYVIFVVFIVAAGTMSYTYY